MRKDKAVLEGKGRKVIESSRCAKVQGAEKKLVQKYIYFTPSFHEFCGVPSYIYRQASTVEWKSTVKYLEKRHTQDPSCGGQLDSNYSFFYNLVSSPMKIRERFLFFSPHEDSRKDFLI